MDAFAKSTEFIRGNTFLKRGHLRKALDFPARKWDTRLARRHSSTCRAGRWRLLTANLNFPYGAPGFGREFPYVTRKTGWNRMVSACFLRSCFFGSVPPAMRGAQWTVMRQEHRPVVCQEHRPAVRQEQRFSMRGAQWTVMCQMQRFSMC